MSGGASRGPHAGTGRSGETGRGAHGARGGAASALDDLHARGHLADIDRHFGAFVAEIDSSGGSGVALAAALASAHAREGHTCMAMESLASSRWPGADGVELPELAPWLESLAASPAVRAESANERRPLVLDARGRLYLERLWTAERQVERGVRALARPLGAGLAPESELLDAALDRFFPPGAPSARPRAAARAAPPCTACAW